MHKVTSRELFYNKYIYVVNKYVLTTYVHICLWWLFTIRIHFVYIILHLNMRMLFHVLLSVLL